MMNWTTTDSTNFTIATDANGDINYLSNHLTLELPDPLIDWLPNSCLYTKYVPTWHLVRSYQ